MGKIRQLFLTFFKIGAFTFGGGYAMIPLIEKEVVDGHRWMEREDIMEVVAIAESTPGPIAINAATFVGYRVAGFWGALAATTGVVLPSLLIIVLIASVFENVMEYELVKQAFWGIRIAVLALMVRAFISMYKQCPKSAVSYLVAIAGFLTVVIWNVNVLYVIAAAAIVGILAGIFVGVKR